MFDPHQEAQDTVIEFPETSLGVAVTIRVRATGKFIACYYVLMGTTSVTTQLDFEDEAWRRACRDRLVMERSRPGFVFELM